MSSVFRVFIDGRVCIGLVGVGWVGDVRFWSLVSDMGMVVGGGVGEG